MRRLSSLAAAAAVLSSAGLPAWSQAAGGQTVPQEAPGPLSRAHAVSPGPVCAACHDADRKVLPSSCLGCHQEIAREAGAAKGFHRDKSEGCADCHAEHQGAGKSIVPLDVKNFDHKETGADLRGAHLKVTDCRRCHRPENTLPRTTTISYILKDSGCRACHRSPHAGRQDDCLACHDQTSWAVDRLDGGF